MGLEESIRKRSLQDLDGEDWGEPNFGSHVVTECHRLRLVALETMAVEDLRLLIGQEIGLEYLLPLAFEHLASDPWVSGDFYEGDLLKNVVSVPKSLWLAHPDFKRMCDSIVRNALRQAEAAEPWQVEEEFYDERVLRQLQEWSGKAEDRIGDGFSGGKQ